MLEDMAFYISNPDIDEILEAVYRVEFNIDDPRSFGKIVRDASPKELIEIKKKMTRFLLETGKFFNNFLGEHEKIKSGDTNVSINNQGFIMMGGDPAIYGIDKQNRYFVQGDTKGEIFFSRKHGSHEAVALAEKLGFTIY